MSETDVRITLSACDRASPVIRGVISQLDHLKRSSQGAFNTAQVDNFARSFRSLSASQSLWASRNAREQRETAAGFTALQRQMRDLNRQYGRLGSHQFGPSQDAIRGWRNLRAASTRDANARARLDQEIAQARQRMLNTLDSRERRLHRERLTELRRRAAEEDRHERQRIAAHRNAMARARSVAGAPFRALDRLHNPYFSSPAFAATMASAAAVMGARSLVRTATTSDTAETYSRIHGFDGLTAQQSREQASLLRRSWAVPQGYAMGASGADMINAWTEVTKAGVADVAMAKAGAELGVRAAKALGIDVGETIEQMGYAIASEFGSGRLTDIAGVHRLINTATALASQSAANPQQMMSFLRTGLGAGANLGLSQDQTLAFGALAVESGAEGQQAARMLSTMGTRLAELSMDENAIRRSGSRSAQDMEFLQAPQTLGFSGGWRGVEQMLAADPGKLFDFISSFENIEDDAERKRLMHSVFGQEFVRFLEQMLQRPASSEKLQRIAAEAYEEAQGKSFLDRAFATWTESMQFELDQIASAWSSLAEAVGRAFKPMIGDVADYAGLWLGKSDEFASMFHAGLDGLIDGLLGFDGDMTDLLQGMFGHPDDFERRGREFYAFAHGFASGIRSIVETGKALLSLFPGVDAGTIGQWAGAILGLSLALKFLAPVLGIIGGLAAMIRTLAGALVFAKGAGITAGAAGMGGAAAAGAGAVAGFPGLLSWLTEGSPTSVEDFDRQVEEQGRIKQQMWGFLNGLFGGNSSTGSDLPGFANGGSFKVGGAGGTDSKLVQFWATPGEQVSIATPNQIGAGGIMIKLSTAGIESRLGEMVTALYRLEGGHRDYADRMRVASLGSSNALRSAADSFTGFASAPSSFSGLPGGGSLGGTPFGPNFYYPNLSPGQSPGSYSGGVPGNAFFDAIIKAEGTARDGNPYNEVLGYGAYGRPSKPLTEMTLDEVKAFGLTMRREQHRQGKAWNKTSSASGAFQIVGTTMMDAAKALGMDPSTTKFNEQTQKRMALWIAQKQGLGAWEGFKHHPGERQRAASALATGATPTAGGSPAEALRDALRFEGMDEYRDTATLASYMGGWDPRGAARAWCAQFVNSAMGKQGIQGTGNAVASSFLKWGTEVADKAMVQAGDVLIDHRGRKAGETGAHVGMATGRTRMGAEGLEVEMFSGNEGNKAVRSWYDADKLAIRRAQGVNATQLANAAPPTPATLAQSVPMPAPAIQRLGSGANGGAGGGAPQVVNNWHINGANQSPEEIANAVQRKITESMNWRTHDIEHGLA